MADRTSLHADPVQTEKEYREKYVVIRKKESK